jgi:hypothetical protein
MSLPFKKTQSTIFNALTAIQPTNKGLLFVIQEKIVGQSESQSTFNGQPSANGQIQPKCLTASPNLVPTKTFKLCAPIGCSNRVMAA